MQTWMCLICGFIYDEAAGRPEDGIPPGTVCFAWAFRTERGLSVFSRKERFMGGREYDAICQRLGGDIKTPVTQQDIQGALDNLWMVTPDFSSGNGPYGGLEPKLQCPLPAPSAGAIATLYCALMIDQRLNDLQASGAIYIEGAFLKNPLLCQLVAQLRSEQPVSEPVLSGSRSLASSAAEPMLEVGALTTMTPACVAASTTSSRASAC